MSSIWKLNGEDIYVDEYENEISPAVAELNPINSTSSTYHYIYTPDDNISIRGHVIGSARMASIEAGIGGEVTLITDLLPGGVTVLFESWNYERLPTTCQQIDGTLPTNAPVYRVTAILRL